MSRNLEARIIRLEKVRTNSGLTSLTDHELDVSTAVLWEQCSEDEEAAAKAEAAGFDPEQERDLSPSVVLPVLRKVRALHRDAARITQYNRLIAVYSTAPEGVRKLHQV